MPIFNPSTREYLIDLTGKNDEYHYKLFSILPTIFLCICSILYPFITNILSIFGVTIFSYDAYIVPLLMKMKISKNPTEILYLKILTILLIILSILGLIGIFI